MQAKCILVTGGCGAIGSVVVNSLASKYPHVRFVNLDQLTYAGKASNIDPSLANYKLYQGSITNHELVRYILASEKPDIVLHLAAETHVDSSFGNSFLFTQTNVFGTHTLLECCRQYVDESKQQGVSSFNFKFIHMSTDEVYGSVSDADPACKEQTSLLAPSNPYSASKAAAEMLCQAYFKSFKLPIIILRCNNAVSPFQHSEKLIPRVITCLALTGDPVPVHGDGSSKRTFIDALDISSAIETVITSGMPGSIYNIGNHEEYSVLDVVRIVFEKLSSKGLLKHMHASFPDLLKYTPDRAFQDYRYAVDTSALNNMGWTPTVSFSDAIDKVISQLVVLE